VTGTTAGYEVVENDPKTGEFDDFSEAIAVADGDPSIG
jgi:hypothetical protein